MRKLVRVPRLARTAIMLLGMSSLVTDCAPARPRTLAELDYVLITRVTTDRQELEAGDSLAVIVRIVNRGKTEARFGDKVSGPWLRVVYIGDEGVPDGWVGTGEALSPFVVGPGQEQALSKTIKLGGSAPAGQYLVELDNHLADCGRCSSLLAIPAIVRVRSGTN